MSRQRGEVHVPLPETIESSFPTSARTIGQESDLVLRLEWGVEARRAGERDLRLSDDATVANSSRTSGLIAPLAA